MAEKQNIFKFLHKTVTLNLIWQDNCSALLLGSITNLKAMKLSHSSLKFNNIRYNFRFLSANCFLAWVSKKKHHVIIWRQISHLYGNKESGYISGFHKHKFFERKASSVEFQHILTLLRYWVQSQSEHDMVVKLGSKRNIGSIYLLRN